MFTFIRTRIDSARLAGRLSNSLVDEGDRWTVEKLHVCGTTVASGDIHITITPRAMRILDRINLYCDGAEVWLPLLSRLRLRSAVRLLVTRHADMLWLLRRESSSMERPAHSA